MLTKFKVENFKSIHSLELELGRVNVFIGENGSGKSNVLEAVAVASAATSLKLNHEFLAPRGIRVTSPEFMRSAFDKNNIVAPIIISLETDYEEKIRIQLDNENTAFSQWKPKIEFLRLKVTPNMVAKAKPQIEDWDLHQKELEVKKATDWLAQKPVDEKIPVLVEELYYQMFAEARLHLDFMVFAPENTSLRNFSQEGQIQPLGIHGQGLFRLLQYFASQPDQPAIRELNERLQLFGWFDSFALPERLWPGESFLKIKDRYLDANIDFIDQRSANEGFLFVLFYLSLFISKDTPKFFAIDNIENSLNPKMCTKLMTTVAELAKAHDKQVMITTHSPAILDGIDLNDDEQRLFVVYRNAYGHTVAKRVQKPQPLLGQVPAKLSELFMMGHLGGLPKNFSL